MGTVLSDSNEAMRCEYISAILHASPQKRTYLGPPVRSRWRRKHRTCRFRNQGPRGINLYYGRKVVQREKAQVGRSIWDDYDYIYGIVTTATEWYFILFASDGISFTSKNPLNIRFSESALKEGSEEEKELHKNVKRVMEVIVGLLKDRVDVEREPDRALA
ncbi:hypothetical protein RhiirA4_536549 [Rhizophagus irregularis]|uniref:Uncharacterized protein n=1 Tax=Rhizophagus irregularis TaxID=588596 RepID=A0A2I1FTB2_9GLOM|nr:hypothetical protein RhiirA4_536549 [Rhizophagus irregularis]